MHNHHFRKVFHRLALVESASAIALAIIAFYLRTAPLLAAGPPENGDLYAYSWGFQAIVFLLFWLPTTLVVTATLLAVQYPLLKLFLVSSASKVRSNYSLKRTDQSLRD